ncbi:MAG: FMN-binding negative transcriptional regulator [Nocardioidaceae bacterium]
MYVPHFNAVDDPAEVEAFVRAAGAAELVTVGDDGTPLSTRLPVIWLPGESRLVVHMARANPHWRRIAPGARALAIVSGADAYVSPSWYASKAEHGRVVPTWNYSAVHLTGTVTVHDDPAWVREAVTELTELHESRRAEPWAVTDAPGKYVEGQLRAIVGLEMRVEAVEAKAKLSQNRSDEDRAGVVEGLRAEPDRRSHAVADAMDR